MKLKRKLITMVAVFSVATLGAFAAPVYYTILHALDADTMEVFRDGGSGSISMSNDGGETYETITRFNFDSYGRGVARVYKLNNAASDTPIQLVASFNESDQGQPADTVVNTTAGEFLDSLMRYRFWSWLAYAPVYVSYEQLPSIVDIAVTDGRFTNLVAAVVQEELADTLANDGPYTVFAPTDSAFELLGLTGADLLAVEGLKEILLYHVLPGALDGDAVAAESHIETLLGKDVDVEVIGGELFINNAKVVLGNLEASNGIVHVIDAVLLPPELPTIVDIAVSDGRFTNLVAAVIQENLADTLSNDGPFTVFAPTDAAFEALGATGADLLAITNLAEILLYHVVDGALDSDEVALEDRLSTLLGEELKVNVDGDRIFINDSEVIIANLKAENGIVHVIDMVLIPTEMPDIVDVAEAAGIFNTLIGALEATELDEVLRSDGPYTVFAPTDEAFEALPSWLLRYLVNNPKLLASVLLYHVVPGDLDAGEVIDAGSLTSANGRSLRVRTYGDNVYINSSKVIEANIEAENGTIHVIDKVLLPWSRY